MSATRLSRLAVALGVAAALLGLSASGAAAMSAYSWCVRAAASQLDPNDINVRQASVSAASRLAVAIRLREAAASCQRHTPARRRHLG